MVFTRTEVALLVQTRDRLPYVFNRSGCNPFEFQKKKNLYYDSTLKVLIYLQLYAIVFFLFFKKIFDPINSISVIL